MSEKLCPYHHQRRYYYPWHHFCRDLLCCLLFLVILVLLAVLIIWLVLRPTKPRFYLQDAVIYSFNTTGGVPSLLNSNIQVTIASRNPNDRVGIYYDRLLVYAAYKYQQITPPAAVTPIYQGHKDILLWSPFLCGVEVPLAPFLAAALERDHAAGVLLLDVKLDGRIRWKVGSWTSGHYHLFVDCPAVLSFGGEWGSGASPVVRYERRIAACKVSV